MKFVGYIKKIKIVEKKIPILERKSTFTNKSYKDYYKVTTS